MEFMNTQIQYTFCLHILDMIHLCISGSFQFLFLNNTSVLVVIWLSLNHLFKFEFIYLDIHTVDYGNETIITITIHKHSNLYQMPT